MATWEGAMQGGQMGAQTGNPYIALAAALAGGLLSKKPQYTEMQKLQMQQARDLGAYARGVPGSDPQEAAMLAQLRGQLGQEQQQGLGMLYSGLSPTAITSQADMLRNVGSSFAQERGNLDMQALMEFFNKRRQAMLGSAQIAGAVGAPRKPGSGENLPALFGQLASLYSQRQAMKGGGGGGGIGAQGTRPGGVDTTRPGGLGLEMPTFGGQPIGGVPSGLQPPSYGGISPGFLGNQTLEPGRAYQSPGAPASLQMPAMGTPPALQYPSRLQPRLPQGGNPYDINQFLQGPTLQPRRRR